VASEVRIRAEGTKDVVSAAYQEPTLNISSPSLEMRFCEGLYLQSDPWRAPAPGICSHHPALFEAVGIFQCEHERERGEHSYSLNLS
jgi:hypothetical protein